MRVFDSIDSILKEICNCLCCHQCHHCRRRREVAARVPQPSLLLAVYQPLPGRSLSQLFLHNAGHRGRRNGCPKWVMNLQSLFFPIHHASSVGMTLLTLPAPNSFHSLVIDVTMALDTLSLPVLEPLTPGRLLDVTVLALSCLYAGAFSKKLKLWSADVCWYLQICYFLGVSVATCMAILQVGSGLQLRTASTGSKEEDYENDAATIVQKCVSGIFSDLLV